MFQGKIKIISNKQVSNKNYFHLTLKSADIATKALPGQFVQVKISDTDIPLLRRPLSIHRVGLGTFDILYEAIGPATELLAQKIKGEYLDVIGPLGTGFEYPFKVHSSKFTVLVAGGMGVAPLIFLAERLKKMKNKKEKVKIMVLIGAKTKSQVLCEKEFKELGCEVKIATEDGSQGFQGYVSELLKKILTPYPLPLTTIYACGPRPFLKEISLISQKYNLPAQISLEEHMACGIGACLGCVVKTKTGFKRVCKEGPVFEAQEIIW